MNCPICNGDTRVLHTADTERRRECVQCKHRFPTVEILRDEHRRRESLLQDARALAEKLVA
jgi:transcriptional regulator NrdR family protein